MTPENYDLKDFIGSDDFDNLIKEPTYFKSTSPTTIDLFLTNRKGCFIKSRKSSTNETGISEHYKLIYTFLNSTCAKGKRKFVYCRYFKHLNKKII